MIFLFLSFLQSASAAPCCAASTALPSLITGDEARSLSLSISSGSVVADAAGAGKGLPVFRDDLSTREVRRNATISFATLISDRWQLGASVPVIQNEISLLTKHESNARLGDVSATLGYEALPEWEYSMWKPRVYIFAQTVLPTGRSINDTQTWLASDVTGMGYTQLHLGAVATKRWSDWDAMAVMKLGKEFSHASSFVNASLGTGYSFAEIWRVGMSLEMQYQSPQKFPNSFTSQRLVWNTGATVTALIGADSSLVAGYSDQTLFGPAMNTTLARTVSLAFQQRFER